MYILTTGKLKVELMTDETTMNWEKGNELPVASTVLAHVPLSTEISFSKNLD